MSDVALSYIHYPIDIIPLIKKNGKKLFCSTSDFNNLRSANKLRDKIVNQLSKGAQSTNNGINVNHQVKALGKEDQIFDRTLIRIDSSIDFSYCRNVTSFPEIQSIIELNIADNGSFYTTMTVQVEGFQLNIEKGSSSFLLDHESKEWLLQFGEYANNMLLIGDVLDALLSCSHTHYSNIQQVSKLWSGEINRVHTVIYNAIGVDLAVDAIVTTTYQ